MFESITKRQLQEIEGSAILSTVEFHRVLEKYTGIEARPYKAYQYFDSCGNYLGDSGDSSLEGLLEAACIKVVDDDAVNPSRT